MSTPASFPSASMSASAPRSEHKTFVSVDDKEFSSSTPVDPSKTYSSSSVPAKSDSSFTASVAKSTSSFLNRVKSQFHSIQQRPTLIRCSACAIDLPVPEAVWNWTCSSSHLNDYSATQCSACNQARPILTAPQIQCTDPTCRTFTAVSSTQLENVIKRTLTQASKNVSDANAPPKQFHCGSCNTLLTNPVDKVNWKCSRCTVVNNYDRFACTSCQADKPQAILLCGACKQPTAPPAMKAVDRAKSLFRKWSVSGEKAYLKTTGTAFVDCPTCNFPCTLPKTMNPVGSDSSSSSGNNSGNVSGNSSAASTPTNANSTSSTPSSERRASWSLDLHCSNCNNNFSVTNELTNVGSSDSAVGGAAPAMAALPAAAQRQ